MMKKRMFRAGEMCLTPDLVARVDRAEPDPGPEPGACEPTDADFHRMVETLLNEYAPADLWFFAHGSSMWNPEFEYEECHPAVARGWHRAYCLKSTRRRGTREYPALMVALDRGGSCNGVVYRLPSGEHAAQVDLLMRREVDANPPMNVCRWISVHTSQGPFRALALVADRCGPAYVGKLGVKQVARIVAHAAGHWGSSAQYLHRTVSMLEAFGVRDRNLWAIQVHVAEEIPNISLSSPPKWGA
jgi:cation transport protein ChaC